MSEFRPQTNTIGWIGTGVMGNAMALRLIKAGWRLIVTTRTPSKAQNLLDLGAQWEDSPFGVACRSDVVVTMVGYPKDLKNLLDGEKCLLHGMTQRRVRRESSSHRPVWVDMTTSSPTLAREIFSRTEELGLDALDAPVSGGDVGAREGTLSIMVGGLKTVFEQVYPIFQTMGKTIVYHGEAGSGQNTKMVNQILIAGTMAGMAEALLYARKSGLDPDRVLASVASGAAGSWSLSHLAPRILRGDFAPGFYVEHFVKDMRIALEESDRMYLSLPILSKVCDLYQELLKAGYGRNGSQVIVKGIAHRCGEEW